MKTLFLLRHGTPIEKTAKITDKDRALLTIGRREIKTIGERLKDASFRMDRIITSPALRALQSAKIILAALKLPSLEISTEEALYKAQNIENIVQIIQCLDNRFNTVLFVGHNPLFEEFSNFVGLSPKRRLPPAGLVGIKFAVDTWREIAITDGEIVYSAFPDEIS